MLVAGLELVIWERALHKVSNSLVEMAQFGVGGIALQAPQRPMFLAASKEQQPKATGFLDWIRQAIDKASFSETDPILSPANEGSSNGAATSKSKQPAKKTTASAPPEKKGGPLGGLFGSK